MALIDPKQIAALPAVFGASGRQAKIKLWIGETTTSTTGAWSVDLTSAAFTAAPRVLVNALSADTTIGNSAEAVLTARSTTAASGFVNIPTAAAVGALATKRAGAGLTVMVLAIGP